MVLVERHIPHVVQLILDRPMLPYPGQHVHGQRASETLGFQAIRQGTPVSRKKK